MALTIAYINEVLNHIPSTVIVDEAGWTQLQDAFAGKLTQPLEEAVLGQMRFRWVPNGYEGLMTKLAELSAKVEELTKQLEEATAPVQTTIVVGADAPAVP